MRCDICKENAYCKYEQLKDTDDDWYPCYPNKQVLVRCDINLPNGCHLVVVRGMDDCLMDKFFKSQEIDKATSLYKRIISAHKVNQHMLSNLGLTFV